MKTILITGSEGLVGSNLYHYFHNKKYRVIGVDKKRPTKTNCYQYDLSHSISLNAITPNWIIHLAAKIDQKNKHSPETLKNNFLSTLNTINYARRKKVDKIIYASSISVYTKPLTSYGLSKLIGEQIINTNNIPSISFRLGYVLGNPLPKKYFIYQLIKKLKNNQPITIINPQNIFSFIHVSDIAAFFEAALKNKHNGIYNLAGTAMTIENVLKTLLKYYPNYSAKISFKDDKESKLKFKFSNSKTKKRFGLKYQNPIKSLMSLYN